MRKIFLLLVLTALLISGCGGSDTASDKMRITASFYPMGEFARNIGGDKVDVTTLVPDGAEPHDWEPSPRDLTKIGKSEIFVYNGMVEPWAEQALTALSERNITAVKAGEGLYARNGKQDPHVWISPKKAMEEVRRITDAMCAADKVNADYYRQNGAAYLQELQKLDKQLTEISQNAPRKIFVTAHAAFGHLADDYGLTQLAVRGLSTEAEPTPADLQRLIKVVKENNIKYVFFETLTDPKIAKIVAEETGAQTAVLDPLEGLNAEGRKNKLDYIKIMQRNIDALAKALNER